MNRPPWLAFAADADRVWSALQRKQARFVRLFADGQIIAVNYDARGPFDLIRLAASGLEFKPLTQTLEVVGVTPNYQSQAQTHKIVTFKVQEVAQ
jgi:hypothetical protein